MEHVTVLNQRELVRFNPDQLEHLFLQVGEAEAENIVCRALEELAARLSYTERCYRENRLQDMRKCARSLIAISEQIGMQMLADVAADVTNCIDDDDQIAIAATLARLLRIGESSLTEIWELQDQSI